MDTSSCSCHTPVADVIKGAQLDILYLMDVVQVTIGASPPYLKLQHTNLIVVCVCVREREGGHGKPLLFTGEGRHTKEHCHIGDEMVQLCIDGTKSNIVPPLGCNWNSPLLELQLRLQEFPKEDVESRLPPQSIRWLSITGLPHVRAYFSISTVFSLASVIA